MKIKINKDLCIGCGTCSVVCPKIFKLNDEYKAEVLKNANLDDCDIDLAIESCPTGAIKKITK